jgi:O-acetylhomoserine (thiol)-lyase
MPANSKNPETLVLHSGYRSDPTTTAVAVPIYQTTSFQFHHTQHASNLFALAELGNIYSRIGNPTCDVLETRMAALEGGVAGLALGSGQAASLFAVQNICHTGDNFVASTDLYGGTWNLFANTLKTMGVECRFVDPEDPENFRRATDQRTRCYYAETLPNPKLTVFPIAEVAKIGRELGVPLIMDNTAAPVLCRPLDHGAAIVLHSTTKYIGGHGTSIGGILVDGGNFDWARHKDRFPMLNTPDPSYHGAVWTEAVKPLGPIAYIIKARVTLLRDIGAPMSPFNAYSGAGNIAFTHARSLRKCQCGSQAYRQARQNFHGHLSFAYDRRNEASSRCRLVAGVWRTSGIRVEGRNGGGPQVYRRLADALSCSKYWRCPQPRNTPRFDDAFAALAGRAGKERSNAGLCAAVDRH